MSPALQALRGRLDGALADGSRGGTASRSSKRLRSVLVATQFAMALAVLVGAGVLLDLLHTRLDIDPGFDPDGLITAQLSLPSYKYADAEARGRFYEDLRRELEELPGQSAWAFASSLPRTNSRPSAAFSIDSRPVEEAERPTAMPISVSNGYFDGFEIPLHEGRAFGPDDLADRPSVVIVNERFVVRHFEGEDPVGARITIFDDSREIVGVARDIVQTRMSGLEPIPSTVFFPVAQRPATTMSIALRADGDPHALAGPLQSAVWRVDPDQPITAVRTIDEHIALVLAGPRIVGQIVFSVGLLTLALASIGVYGVMAFSVNQQAREIGIRMALGAQGGRVLRRIGGQGIILAGAGLILGIPLSMIVVQTIRASLASPEFSSENGIGAAPIVTVTMLLVGVALLACYLPARRATKIDPIRALQEE